jgi:hypothetical protein
MQQPKLYNKYIYSIIHGYSLNTAYKYHNLPVVLYGCETLSLSLKEEHRLRMFENRVQRRTKEG